VIGELCALGAALSWATSLILFKRSEAISPLGMNLFKNTVAMVLLTATLLVLGEGIDTARSGADWGWLVLSGLLGIALADTLIFMALRRLGAGLLAIVDCAYAPVMVGLAVLILGEPLTLAFAGGGVLVVGGVLLAVSERSPAQAAEEAPPTEGSKAAGAVIGVLGIVFMGLGVMAVKPLLERGHLVEVTLMRLIAGIAGQLLWIAAIPSQRTALRAFKERSVWKTLLPGSILGTYVAMLLWLGGFKWTSASIASVLNQTASVFTLLFAWLFLSEPLTPRRLVGCLAALAGAAAVIVGTGA
jgi:drug/metabolite transporter (DMT)-like permease